MTPIASSRPVTRPAARPAAIAIAKAVPAPAAPAAPPAAKAQAPAPARAREVGAWVGGALGGLFGAAGGAALGGAALGIMSLAGPVGTVATVLLLGTGAVAGAWAIGAGGATMGRSAERMLRGEEKLRMPTVAEFLGGGVGGVVGAGAGYMTGFVGSVLGAPDVVIRGLMAIGPVVGGLLGVLGGGATAGKLFGEKG